MALDEDARQLADFTKSLPDFKIYQEHEIDKYDHIGAAVADAVLQARRDYDSFVTPRTERIVRNWPNAKTVSAVLECLESVPASDFISCDDNQSSPNYLAHRVERFKEVLHLFKLNGIESTDDLRLWLAADENSAKLSALFGVGPKTTEYLKILVGAQTVAPDVRLWDFLSMAGLEIRDPDTAREVLGRAADLLSIPRSCFDHSIWQYIGAKKSKRAKSC